MENSNHPDTAAMAERLAALADAPAQFRNFDLVNEDDQLTDKPGAPAGFVPKSD